jgi:hypothetical protein
LNPCLPSPGARRAPASAALLFAGRGIRKALNADTAPLIHLLAVVSDWREKWLSCLRTATLPNKPLQRSNPPQSD